MTGLNHGWDGDERVNHADFRHGGVPIEDFDDEFRYKKPSRSNFNGKRKRACKKSKTGEKCDFSVVKSPSQWYDVVACSRCGKYGDYLWKRNY